MKKRNILILQEEKQKHHINNKRKYYLFFFKVQNQRCCGNVASSYELGTARVRQRSVGSDIKETLHTLPSRKQKLNVFNIDGEVWVGPNS